MTPLRRWRRWLLLAGGGALLLLVAGVRSAYRVTEGGEPELVGGKATKVAEREGKAGDGAAGRVDRARKLEEFKTRWLEWQARPEDDEARDALETECAEGLLCSGEMVQLILFLGERRILAYPERKVSELFGTARATEARSILVEMNDLKAVEYTTSYREAWSWAAGFHCDPKEIDGFVSALGEGVRSQEAVFGFNRARVGREPEAAVAAVVKQVMKGIWSVGRDESLVLLVISLPEGVDAAAIEALLPVEATEVSRDLGAPWSSARSALLKRWAGRDAGAAAGHVMAHPDRMGPEMMGDVAEGIMEKGFAVEWLDGIPKGAYFDHAATSVALWLAAKEREDQAGLVAQRIGDSRMRDSARSQVEIWRRLWGSSATSVGEEGKVPGEQ